MLLQDIPVGKQLLLLHLHQKLHPWPHTPPQGSKLI